MDNKLMVSEGFVTNSFLADFVEKILSLGPINTVDINGSTYSKDILNRIDTPEATVPKPIQFKTLSGLIGYIVDSIDAVSHSLNDGTFIQVADFNEVNLYGHLKPEASNRRFLYAEAKLHAESFRFGQWYDLEGFIIAIQSMFVADETTNSILECIGNMANEIVTENKDDGLSQSIQVRTGVTTKSKVKITNPMTLRPFRTFREVVQPESKFVFRIRKREGLEFSLHESDGGKWKLEAITNIKEWLISGLKSSPNDLHKAVVIG